MRKYPLARLSVFFLLGLMAACSPETPGEGENQAATEVNAEPISLEETGWQLVKIQSLGNFEFNPEDPSLYTVRFRFENRLVIKSDCNSGGATWIQDGGQLVFEQFVSTRAMCTPGTLHNRFISQLIGTQSFAIRDGHLFLSNMTPDAYLEFEPIQ